MLDDTLCGKLLLDKEVEIAIKKQSKALDTHDNVSEDKAKLRAPEFLYGPREYPSSDYSALRNSVWNDASHDHVASLKSDVSFIGIKAPHGRIDAQVELPAALAKAEPPTSVIISGDQRS